MIAVFGGSGFEKFDEFETIEMLPRETPFGLTSSGFKRVRVDSHEFLFISRHGERHENLPSEVNYRANVFAVKAHGAHAIVSVSSVGSLRAEFAPEHLVIPLQFIDRTKGIRRHTFCGEGVVGHMSLAYPVYEPAARKVAALAVDLGIPCHVGGAYVCIEGPNFSTLAESLAYRELPADVIGMTNAPEFALAREAGLDYLPCSFITDYDCWDTSRPHVTLEEVIAVMRRNNSKAFQLLRAILPRTQDILSGSTSADQGLRTGLMVPLETLSEAQKSWYKTLTS